MPTCAPSERLAVILGAEDDDEAIGEDVRGEIIELVLKGELVPVTDVAVTVLLRSFEGALVC